NEIVAVAADQQVVAVAAGDRVVAGSAIDGQVDAGKTVPRRDHVIAAVGVDHEVLDRAGVDGEGPRIGAGEQHVVAVSLNGERLRGVAEVDLDRVVAGSAVDHVAAVARLPDQSVVAGPAEHLVAPRTAGDRAVPGAAEYPVVAALPP